jgi:hypothetical protein
MARLDEGFPTKINLTGAGVTLYEKTVKPAGIDGGEPVNTTTMRNTAWRTFNARVLMSMTPMTTKVAYAVAAYTTLTSSVNSNMLIVVTFPDDSTLSFWGYIQKFEPDDIAEGKQPEATITIQPTNQNGSGVEVAPVVG